MPPPGRARAGINASRAFTLTENSDGAYKLQSFFWTSLGILILDIAFPRNSGNICMLRFVEAIEAEDLLSLSPAVGVRVRMHSGRKPVFRIIWTDGVRGIRGFGRILRDFSMRTEFPESL